MQFQFPQIDFNCDDFHSDLIIEGEVVCFMCHKQIADIDIQCNTKKYCRECNRPSLIEADDMILCSECGVVDHYIDALDTSFYDSHNMKKKSIYKSKYYIQNVLNQISKKQKMQVPVRICLLICEVIDLIRSSEELMKGRKRIISINYIIRLIFRRAGIKHDFIPLSRSRTTQKKYRAFWKRVMKSDIGNKIRRGCY